MPPLTEPWRTFFTAVCAAGTACALSLALTPLIRWTVVRAGLVSKPLHDRWGRRVVARFGGVAIVVGFTASALVWVPMTPLLLRLLIGLGLVFLWGLVDDWRRMPPYTKLLGQLLIGCAVTLGGTRIQLVQWDWLAVPLTVLWFVFVINAFNLLDNMDGLAVGTGAIASGFCAVHAVLIGQWPIVTLNAMLCGACLGFLRYNFPPAKIYMGDSGSHFLGLSLAAFSVLGSWQHSTQLVSVLAIPTLVLALPIFDTCFVTIQRLVHRIHPFVGGTDHVSHRLAVLGLSVRQTVIVLYGVSVALGLLSLLSVNLPTLTAVTVWVLVAATLGLWGLYLARVNVYRLAPTGLSPSVAQEGSATLIKTMLLHKRRLVEIVLDFCLLSSAYVMAYLLRFEGKLAGEFQFQIVQSLPILLAIKLSYFAACGLYRGVWRYMGLSDLMMLVRAVTLGSVFSAVAFLYLWRFQGYSRAVFIIDWMFSFMLVGGARVLERILDEWIRGARAQGIPVLIIGAGDSGVQVLRSLRYEPRSRHRVVGFLDDDPYLHGTRIDGTPVLGGHDQLEKMLDQHTAKEVLVAISDPPGSLLQHVQQCCQSRHVPWRVVTASLTATS